MSYVGCLLLLILALPSMSAAAEVPTVPTAGGPTLTLEDLRAKYADAAGKIASIDGIDVYYKDEGRGEAILMVHGSVSTLKVYDGVAAELRKRYRVIRYDVPSQGLSGPISDAAAAKLKPTDIAEGLLEKLGVKSVTAVGNSSGGTLCMFLAAKRPDLVKRLILANTPADPVDTSHMKQPQDLVAAQNEAQASHFKSQHFWDLFLTYFSGEPERMTPYIREQFYDFNRRVQNSHEFSLVAVVADHQATTEAMAKVVAPTLLVWGARDRLLVPHSADVTAGYLTSAAVSKVLLPDVGHYPPLEVPQRFAQIVATYIEAVTPVEPKSPPPEDR